MSNFHKRGIPTQRGLIQRPHLQDILSQAIDYPVTLLSAPPGCGKTSVASQLAESIKCNVIWHNVTAYQQDMRTMITHLLQTLSDFVPEVQTLNSLIEQPAEIIAHELALILQQFTSKPFLIVFDDWQRFSIFHPANQWLKTFVNFMPNNCHVLILSQTIPPLDMLTMIAKRQMLSIPQEDLFFTEAEVYLLASKAERPVSPDIIQLVWERMNGWPAGTSLALHPLPTDLLFQLGGDSQPSDVLFQSIAHDMLKEQAPHIQQFLKWTSTVEVFTSHICTEILDVPDWEESLAEVLSLNLFIQRNGVGYQYHELFRVFLQTHFQLNEPESFASAHRRVAGWYQSQGLTDRAISHYLKAGANHQAIYLLESLVHSYFVQGRVETLRQFSDAITDVDIPTPNFDYVRLLIALDYDRDADQATIYAKRALYGFEQKNDTEWYNRTLYQMAYIAFFKGAYEESYQLSHDMLKNVEEYPELYGLVLRRRGMSHYFLGRLDEAIADLEEAQPLLEQHSGWFRQSSLLQDMEVVYRDLGNKEAADTCLHNLITLRRMLDNREQLALALNNLGYLYYEEGKYDEAREVYLEGLEIIRLLESGRSRYFLLASLADLERDCGYYEKAREYYQDALLLVGTNEPYMRCETLTHLATVYRWQGRAEAAMTCVQDAMTIARSHQLLGAYQEAHIESMHVKLQPYNIRSIAHEAQKYGGNGNGQSIEQTMLQLRLAHSRKDSEALQSITQTLREKYENGTALPSFFAELVNNQTLTDFRQQLMLHNGALGSHLERLIDASNKSTRRIIIPIRPLTSSLQVYSLGTEIIRQDGEHVQQQDWQSKIARELFLYFVFHKMSRRDDISLIFWADKSAESATNLFHQMLARIRQTVGNQTIIYDERNDKYGINPKIHLWCDALRLDTLVAEARKLGTSSVRALDIWMQATQLLTGDFLPDLDYHWVTVLRTKYQALSLEAWMNLGHCHMSQKNYYIALQAFQTAAQHDEIHEAAYRAQMICCSYLNERPKIMYTYNLLKSRLQEQLGIAPSPETDQLLIELLT